MKRIILEDKKRRLVPVRLVVMGLSIFLVVLFLEIWVVNRTSTYGDKIYQLKQAQAALELENQVLSNKIAETSAMVLLEKKANNLGFNTINQIDYIKFSDKLASAN
ncbi:MAG: hypothetical protein PHQ59_03015 [Candidatus Daviesbacteria bacterium]|nr:hypothetical protein [Candidatus Daviesbacteria bacterium]